jgi:hypothetical protein
MVTITAVGGCTVPAIFGRIVPRSGYPTAWLFLGVVTAATALAPLREPRQGGRDRTGCRPGRCANRRYRLRCTWYGAAHPG